MSTTLNKTILEIRIKPNPSIIDLRGSIINKYALLLKEPHWSLQENRVDFYNLNNTIHYFLSFKDLGIYIENPPTDNYFIDKATVFLKNIFEENYMKDVIIERYGLRTVSILPYSGEFNQLKNNYLLKYVNISPQLSKIINDNIYDIGCPIIFETKIGKYNITSGPMKKEQITSKFLNHDINVDENNTNEKSEVPDVGLYVDIDYWNNPKITLNSAEILSILKDFNSSNIKNIQNISKLILGDKYEK